MSSTWLILSPQNRRRTCNDLILMRMSSLLRNYITEILMEMNSNPAVKNQLLPRKKGVKNPRTAANHADKETEEENEGMDEMNVVANIAGFTGPLGSSSEDLKGPGAGKKTKKKSSARWK